MALRLVALAVLALILVSGAASASYVAPEDCPYGAISAIGPVDGDDVGNATAAVRCLEP